MTSIQPELWADRGAQAVAFSQAAFGATVLQPTPPSTRRSPQAPPPPRR